MDRNTVIGLGLIAALIIVWTTFFSPEPEPPARHASRTEQQAATSAPAPAPETVADSLAAPVQPAAGDSTDAAGKFGAFAPLAKGERKQVQVRTDRLTMTIDGKGGAPAAVYLNNYRTWDSLPLPVIPPDERSRLSFQFAHAGLSLDTRDFYFTPSVEGPITVKGKETFTLRLRAGLDERRFLEHVYTFTGNSNAVEYALLLHGLNEEIVDNFVYASQEIIVPQTERARDKMEPEVTVVYKFDEDDVERLDATPDETSEETLKNHINWLAFKSQFFTAAIVPRSKIEFAKVRNEPVDPALGVRKLSARDVTIPLAKAGVDTVALSLVYAPNDVQRLSKYGQDLDEVVSLGWGPLRYITLFIVVVFNSLEQVMSNYGLIILVLALLVKLLLSPLTYRSYLSTAKMQILNKTPEIQALEEKYKDNPTELQQKKLAYYNQAGVSPLGGCVPLLLQMPILFAMFSFFPQSIQLRQKGFLWADDLSTYDSILDFGFSIPFYGDHVSLFTLLMTASQIAYTWVQQRTQGASGGPPGMKYIGYIMPIVFMGILNNYSAGLSYYYFVYNLLTIGHTFAIKGFVKEDKLLAKIKAAQEKRKAGGGKSRMQLWMEEQQRKQQSGQMSRNPRRSVPGGKGKKR